jgi:hypothetical protein
MGRGKVGINAGFIDQSAPKLIQDAVVEGFQTGVNAQWTWGDTVSRLTVRNCRRLGVEVCADVVAIEDLVVENTPQALRCLVPNDWGHWSGVVALVGGRFTGGDPELPAIYNEGVLYARDVKTRGFSMALRSKTPGGDVATSDVTEYVSHEVKSAFDDSVPASLGLSVRREPRRSMFGVWACGWPPMQPIQSLRSSTAMSRTSGFRPCGAASRTDGKRSAETARTATVVDLIRLPASFASAS